MEDKTTLMELKSRVAKSTNKANTQFYTGIIENIKSNKALVYFDRKCIRRWCNISNLSLITNY